MLPKRFQVTLRAHSDFFKQCKKLHSSDYSIYYKSGNTTQAAVIVPKKVARLAVDRNEVKRKYRAALTTVLESEVLKQNLFVIIVHKPGTQKTVAQIEDSLRQHAKHIS